MKLKIKKTTNIYGEISISGSKNACLPILTVCLLTKELVHLQNVPNILDVEYMIELLKLIGVNVKRCIETNEVYLKRKKIKSKINSPYLNQIRASYYLMGVLFSEKRNIKTKNPGGCNFTSRPIDYHLDAFREMGANVTLDNDNILINRKKKNNINVTLKNKSLGTTINIILATVKTKGESIINNPSLEPEVLDLIDILNKMGANIKVKDNQIVIVGVRKLFGVTHKIIPDRMEAGSYMCLAASVENSNVLLKNINIKHLDSVINTFKQSGLNIINENNDLRIIKYKQLNNMKIVADNYPNYPTDLQQPMVSTLLNSNNVSLIKDLIYPNRFSEVFELLSMKATLYLKNQTLLVFPSKLVGKEVYAPDLRAGFSLIIAGAIAEGETIINHSEVILRGYDNLIEKLNNIKIDAEIV
ncbi:MAG: UDP-N-acetylglucosamine 1-carboxyvinyltransferase [Erysipelotrichaceae bacterium]|nr:UDP-N-acetylglucosamine 1-carboxyvinyltransferase [Erysipelotrichaceae bacterium]